MNVWWVRIRSWHVLGSPADTFAYCGRKVGATAETLDNRPSGKTCESCLRALARHVDPDEAGSGAEVIR